jgi:sulfur relay (sulfurtransferase) DsrF/TusC family protein
MTESWHSDQVTGEPVLVDRILLVIKGSPQEDGKVAEGFRVATAMIAMDVLPQILFADDGVFWLVKKQLPESKSRESVSERLKTISDLAGLHVLSDSLDQRKLTENDLDESYNTKKLSLDEAAELVAQNDAVITF